MTKEQSENLNLVIPFEEYNDWDLKRKRDSKLYNLQYFDKNDLEIKRSIAIEVYSLNHPYKKVKYSSTQSESSLPLDLSKNNLLKLQKSNIKETKDVISEESSFEIDVEKINLEHIASRVIEEQTKVLKGIKNIELYKERIEKNKRLKKEFEKYDYNQLCIELKSYLNIEIMYDQKFVIDFLKKYENRKTNQDEINKSRRNIDYFKITLNKIKNIIIPDLKNKLSKISIGESTKEVLLNHFICIENLVNYYQKLLSNYKRYDFNHSKILYWYMRFCVEVHMLEDLFDMDKIGMGYCYLISSTLLYEKSFDKFSNDLKTLNIKMERLLNNVSKKDKYLGEYIIRIISNLLNKK